MRVDNYVYTKEAFEDAKRLLNDNGKLILKFEVEKAWSWQGQRFYAMLGQIFSRAPVVYFAPQTGVNGALLPASVFIESPSPKLWEFAQQPEIAVFLHNHPSVFPLESKGAPPPTTDDWPYIYHRSHSIPRPFLTASVVLVLMTLIRVRSSYARSNRVPGTSSCWDPASC